MNSWRESPSARVVMAAWVRVKYEDMRWPADIDKVLHRSFKAFRLWGMVMIRCGIFWYFYSSVLGKIMCFTWKYLN